MDAIWGQRRLQFKRFDFTQTVVISWTVINSAFSRTFIHVESTLNMFVVFSYGKKDRLLLEPCISIPVKRIVFVWDAVIATLSVIHTDRVSRSRFQLITF